MRISLKKTEIITIVLYSIFVVCYLMVLLISGMGSTLSQIRYFILAVATFVALVTLIQRRLNHKWYSKELLLVIPLSVVLLIVSGMKAQEIGHSLEFRTLVQTSLVLLPALYAFCIVNIVRTDTIIQLMEYTLVCTIIIYFCEPGHRIWDFLKLSNWKNISLIGSSSFTESDICSEIFMQLFLFFNFFKEYKLEYKKNRKLKTAYVISFVFTMACFKRLGIAFAICVLIVNIFVDLRGRIAKWISPMLAITFTVLTFYYTKFMKGELFAGFDVYSFTTGRDYILSLWKQYDYMSFGYGSSLLLTGRYLEMDLVQIYMELNIFVLFLFCYVFFRIAKTNVYSILIMIYAFFNMLTASSLPGSLSWVILLITISCISSTKLEKENIIIDSKKTKLKKLFEKGKKRTVHYRI